MRADALPPARSRSEAKALWGPGRIWHGAKRRRAAGPEPQRSEGPVGAGKDIARGVSPGERAPPAGEPRRGGRVSYTGLFYHIVFSTKQRRPMLRPDTRRRAVAYIGGIVRNMKGRLLKGGGTEDHLRLLVVIHPTTALSRFVATVKSNSTGWLRKSPGLAGFAWQSEYAAFTVSPSAVHDVLRYVDNQAEHHRRVSSTEELIALLDRHGIEYDRRYVFA